MLLSQGFVQSMKGDRDRRRGTIGWGLLVFVLEQPYIIQSEKCTETNSEETASLE